GSCSLCHFTVIHWVDIFIRVECRDNFLESVRYCQKHKGLEVYVHCIMSSHIHNADMIVNVSIRRLTVR
ncbi:MAG TPA: hypothetical protein VEW65_09410, partial [Chryseolinea sp.]|nr:hypothetical protein [Chryseolinea sp.]